MTGDGLRELLRRRGLSPNQFITQAMDYRSDGLEGAARDKARESAKRTVKRWLSERKASSELILHDQSRLMIARLLEVPETDLMADQRRGRVRARLSTVAVEVTDVLDEHQADIDDLRSRVEALEAERSRRRA